MTINNPIKNILLLFLFSPLFCISQTNIDSLLNRFDKIYDYQETDFIFSPDSIEHHLYEIDTLTKLPINGWVKQIKKNKKERILFTHYTNGIRNGFSILYLKIDSAYKKSEVLFWKNGWILESSEYNWDSDSLIPIEYQTNYQTYDYRLNRKIKSNKRKIIVKDKYYYWLSKKTRRIKYQIDYVDTIFYGNYANVALYHFPNTLNAIQNPLIHLKLNGFYSTHLVWYKGYTPKDPYNLPQYYENYDKSNQITKFGADFYVKFYPNSTFKMIVRSNSNNTLLNWQSKDIINGDYFIEKGILKFNYDSVTFKLIDAQFFRNNYSLFQYLPSKNSIPIHSPFYFNSTP